MVHLTYSPVGVPPEGDEPTGPLDNSGLLIQPPGGVPPEGDEPAGLRRTTPSAHPKKEFSTEPIEQRVPTLCFFSCGNFSPDDEGITTGEVAHIVSLCYPS